MAKAMGSIDQRTQLAGHNRFEMLLFKIGRRHFGINVFKIREVIRSPRVTVMPDSRPGVRGIAHLRGQTIPIIDLAQAIRSTEHGDASSVVITEYNRTVQGFLVDEVDRIVNVSWEDVLPPPQHIADRGYVTAVTRVDGVLVQILDVEKVLAEVMGDPVPLDVDFQHSTAPAQRNRLLVVDDSSVARNQIRRTLEPSGWDVTVAKNGEEALEWLHDTDEETLASVALVISDIEMPRMDGYTLTSRIRSDERLRGLKILLHSSLSGVFNRAMVEKVGADDFLAKFDASELGRYVNAMLEEGEGVAG
ncbi:Chemotaxis protein CheV [wastewater metagenome]|uniref:Chemotaxis protein CheV n=2 Tax=unclassified sequences TaxID=12908 RepID=A0A5B8RBP3_9ZZZZ|nr:MULTISPECIES: chemotaxis protein [Arhodomonas]MCS4503253.1 chemotaxis protein [Arhodomonas aquaeolei]QEA05378.1 chemotaxis protein CheV [uncultured organism]